MSYNILAGLRMFTRAHTPFHRHTGNSQKIALAIIRSCFNGTYFQVSSGHFTDFYVRDFGMCVEALINTGYEKEVQQTIDWIFRCYTNKITPIITSKGKPIEYFHKISSDSVPFLLHILQIAKRHDIIDSKKMFLESEIKRYVTEIVNPKTHLVINKPINSIKDHYKRTSSCYDTCMVGWSISLAKELGLYHSLSNVNYSQILKKHYWKGSYFVDDLSKDTLISADANIFPYYCGIITDKTYFLKSYKTLKALELEKPFPIQYTAIRQKHKELFLPSVFAPNYEGTTIWIHLGLCFLQVVQKYVPKDAKEYLTQYTRLIQKEKNFLEVFTKNGKPYTSFWYKSDENMLWVSMYVWLLKKKT